MAKNKAEERNEQDVIKETKHEREDMREIPKSSIKDEHYHLM